MSSEYIALTRGIITDTFGESLNILFDQEDNTFFLEQKLGVDVTGILKLIILDSREAREVADFINERLAELTTK